MTPDSLLPLGIFLGLGFLTQIGEVFWPLRRYSKPKALRLDLVGFAVTILTRITIARFQVPAIERLPRLPAFAWMTDVSRIVEWRVRWPIALLVSVVVLDFLLYIGHRLLHTSLLWHTHAAHHSVEHLYWFGGNRASPFHVAALAAWGTLLGLVARQRGLARPRHGGAHLLGHPAFQPRQPELGPGISRMALRHPSLPLRPSRSRGPVQRQQLRVPAHDMGSDVRHLREPGQRSERLSARLDQPGSRRPDVDRAAAGSSDRGGEGGRPVTPRRRGASGAGYGILHA